MVEVGTVIAFLLVNKDEKMDNETIKNYLAQLNKFPLLTGDEEKELADAIENGDMNARNHLVQANLRLVVSIAKQFLHYRVSFIDLIQEGNIGLLTAATKFRSSFNTRFSTYAYLWIHQAIFRFVRVKNAAIQIPHRVDAQIRRIRASQDYLYQNLGRKPSIEELGINIGKSEIEIQEILKYEFSLNSLDSIIDLTSETTFGHFLMSDTPTPEEEYLATEVHENLSEIIKELSKKEKDVISARFDLSCHSSKNTLRFVGAKLGLSTETVRQVEKRAMKKIKAKVVERDFVLS